MDDQKRHHIISTALEVFYKYGYKRVSMNDISQAAGISRAGLYLFFKSKEEIFNSAILFNGENLIEEIQKGLSQRDTPKEKIYYAFEVWAINIFDQALHSPEIREISDSSYEFAREALDMSYRKFEDVLAALIQEHFESNEKRGGLDPQQLAYLLTSSLRGFKIVAKNSNELEQLIRQLVEVILAP
ncbi:TetR/AcrR family transcriptional regulator [Paenibacillus sp. GCM10012306]|uniref:TetR/AcrR family transcriptional regulator n=1 Tax=Paenibacillus sp. GCM10012306 TaxID=3317342 RepID=UPI00361F9770